MIRFYWRPLIPGEQDPELLWGAILALSGFMAVGWLCSGLPTPLCPLHTLTGFPCLTCGMTRGLRSLLHGDLESAFLFNPLGMAVLFGLVLYLFYAVAVVAARLPRLRWEPLSSRAAIWLRVAVVTLVAMNWIYLIHQERSLVGL